jgi:hypothetical protein
MLHESRPSGSWLIFDVRQKMIGLVYFIVYFAVYVVVPIITAALGALAALLGVVVVGFAVTRNSRSLAAVGILSLVLGGTAAMLLGPFAVSQARYFFGGGTVLYRK